MSQNLIDAKNLRNIKFTGERRKVWDGGGLYLHVLKTGNYWRWDYQFGGQRRTAKLGMYPEMTLTQARDTRSQMKSLALKGEDPVSRNDNPETTERSLTFSVVASEWFAGDYEWSAGHKETIEARLRLYINPCIGNLPIAQLTARDIKAVLDERVAADHRETARKVKLIIGQICRYAELEGYIDQDPTYALRGYFREKKNKPKRRKSFAHTTEPKRLGQILRAIDAYTGSPEVSTALKVLPHIFIRPGELRNGEWSEIDFESAEWILPAHRMKVRDNGDHIVPLSTQSLELLLDLYQVTGRGKLIFPQLRDRQKPISENALNVAMRRMDISQDEQTAHGFRHTASTMLNQYKKFDPDLIETQLHHLDHSTRGKYNSANYMQQRMEMMQNWSDYLDKLKAGAKVLRLEVGR